MTNFALILLCLVAGGILKRMGRFPDQAPQAFNEFIICLSLPALVLVQIPKLIATTDLDASLLVPVSMGWLVLILSLVIFVPVGHKLGWSRAKIGAIVLTAGLGNTSFVGFPLLEALLGGSGLRIGVIADQTGSFLALSTLGLASAAFFGGSRVTIAGVLLRIFRFPPFLALIAALIWSATGTFGADFAVPVFESIAATLVPLALVSVGFQLRVRLSVLRRRWLALSCGLGFKLVLAPAILAALYIGVFAARGVTVHATVLEAAMAPMITAAIIAAEFRLDTELANLMVGVGIPLSLVTVPLWHSLLLLWT